MCTTSLFTKKFAGSIVSVLHCRDRVIFKGYLPFFKDNDLNRLSDYEQRIRRKNLEAEYMKGNWLKMYDKFGVILRVETVINQSREFHVRGRRTRKGVEQMAPMYSPLAVARPHRARGGVPQDGSRRSAP